MNYTSVLYLVELPELSQRLLLDLENEHLFPSEGFHNVYEVARNQCGQGQLRPKLTSHESGLWSVGGTWTLRIQQPGGRTYERYGYPAPPPATRWSLKGKATWKHRAGSLGKEWDEEIRDLRSLSDPRPQTVVERGGAWVNHWCVSDTNCETTLVLIWKYELQFYATICAV